MVASPQKTDPISRLARLEQSVANLTGKIVFASEGVVVPAVAKGELVFDVRDYGAVGDGNRVSNVVANSGSATVTSVTANFTANDVGKIAVIYTDTAAGTFTTIQSWQSPTQVTLAAAAGITVSGTSGYMLYGTDDSAAFTACCVSAAELADVNTSVGPNQPQGLGQPRVLVPHSSPVSLFVLANQITVPTGVSLDVASMLVNLMTDRYAPAIIFSPYTSSPRLYLECMFGTGIQLGSAPGQQADVHMGDIVLWHVGTSVEAVSPFRSQDAVAALGYGFLVDLIWTKGGVRGIYHNAGSDFLCNRADLIGCLTGVSMTQANQVHYNAIILDSCGQNGGGYSGIVLDNGCSQISFEAQAFEVVGLTKTMDNVVLIGNGSTNNNVGLRFRVMAQKTGGNVVNFAKAQDVECDVLASNTPSSSSGGNNITTAVVFGSVAGSFRCHAEMNGSITPYTGTPPGAYRYVRLGVEYLTQGGAPPSPAAQAANGTSPPPVSTTGNDQRGSISFGSGSGPTAGNQVVITFSSATGWVTTSPYVSLTPLTAATVAAQPYVAAASNTSFTIAFANAPAASQAAGTFALNYRIEG